MKHVTTEIRSLRISPDRSLKEKEEVRKMVNEAKKLNDQEKEHHASGPRFAENKSHKKNGKSGTLKAGTRTLRT